MGQEAENINQDSDLSDIISQIDDAIDEAGIVVEDEAEQDPEATDEAENDEALEYIEDADDQGEDQSDKPDQMSESEQQAREKGWRPKEEFDGNPDDWVSHKEFNQRTELYDKISHQSKTIKNLNKKLDALIKHNEGLAERTRKKTLEELKAKQREAVQHGDTEAFEEAEKQIEEVSSEDVFTLEEDETEQETEQAQQIEIPQVVQDFAAKNKWFEKDKEMTDFMIWKTQQVIQSEGLTLEDALPVAEKHVKQTFAHKFRNPNKSKPTSVMGGSNKPATSNRKSISSLTPEQKSVWHTLKGTMTEQEFLDQLGD